jgi:hypothetical protein
MENIKQKIIEIMESESHLDGLDFQYFELVAEKF